MSRTEERDAIIIGGGPAGAAAATILAGYGHRVVVLEREKFPRYHVGESLLPFTYQPLERLGLIERMKASSFQKKYSVQFVAPSGRASQPFYFFNRYDRDTVAQTWQVLRSEFDVMLLDNAREKGAEVIEEITVKELVRNESKVQGPRSKVQESRGSSVEGREATPHSSLLAPHNPDRRTEMSEHLAAAAGARVSGVRAQTKDGELIEFRARVTLDCTGKESFAAVRNGWRMKDPFLNKVAVWTYYEGSKRAEGVDEGQTTVAMIPGKGWFWHIPMQGDLVSVGVVADGKYLSRDGVKDPKAIFERELTGNQWIEDCLSTGRQVGPHYVTSEYSFHSKHCGCEGLLLVGDAFCFLDPVFSSGLMLALKSGVMAGDAVHEALVGRDFSPERFAPYARSLREGIENMRKLVYAFYDPEFSFKKVIDRDPELAGDITDCLSGDVNKDFSRLWKVIAEFVPLPDDLPVGEPLTGGGLAAREQEQVAALKR